MKHGQWIIVSFLVLSYFAQVVFVPIFLALFLAMLLDPLVQAGGRLGLSRQISSIVVVLLFGAFTAILGWLAYTAALEIVTALPTYVAEVNVLIAKVGQMSERFAPRVSSASRVPLVQLAQPYPEWSHFLFSSLGAAYGTFSILLFVPLLMFYFLVDKLNLVESFNVLNGKWFNLPKLNLELPRMLRVFFAANLITGGFLVVAQAVGFLWMGYSNWITLALVSGFLNLVPVVGGGLAIVAPLVLGVGITLSLPLVLSLAAMVLGLHFVANNLLVPLLVGSRLNMNAVALIIGLLFWSWMWGVAGFLLAVPMTALLKILLECNKETYVFANLMSSRPNRVLPGHEGPGLTEGLIT